MNRGTLKQKLGIADHLDDFIAKHNRLKGHPPECLHITREQFAALDNASTPEASRTEWAGIKLKVLK